MRVFKMPEATKPSDMQDTLFKKMKLQPVEFKLDSTDVLSGAQLQTYTGLMNQINQRGFKALTKLDSLQYGLLFIMDSRRVLTISDFETHFANAFQMPFDYWIKQNAGNRVKSEMTNMLELVIQRNVAAGASNTLNFEKFRNAIIDAYPDAMKIIVDETQVQGDPFSENEDDDDASGGAPDIFGTPSGKGTASLPKAAASARRNLNGTTPSAAAAAAKRQYWENLTSQLSAIVRQGLQPLYSFIGMVGVRLSMTDVRKFYKYREGVKDLEKLQDPVVHGCTSSDEFIAKNQHLGRELLALVLKAVLNSKDLTGTFRGPGESFEDAWAKQAPGFGIQSGIEPIGVLVRANDQAFVDAYLNRNAVNGRQAEMANGWVFGSLDTAAMGFILHDSCWGAIAMALSEVRRIPNCANYELKSLIMSEGVRDKFALMVAFNYLVGSGGNAVAGRGTMDQFGKLRGTTYNLSAGFQTRANLAAQIECAHYWFERVYAQANPEVEAELAALDRFDAEHRAILVQRYPPNGDNFLGRDLAAIERAFNAIPGGDWLRDPIPRELRIREEKLTRLKRARAQVQQILVHYE